MPTRERWQATWRGLGVEPAWARQSWVDEAGFRKGRAAILARLLARPRIYATDHFAGLLESQARANLQYSLERLGRWA